MSQPVAFFSTRSIAMQAIARSGVAMHTYFKVGVTDDGA
jgi:hypothetical protein